MQIIYMLLILWSMIGCANTMNDVCYLFSHGLADCHKQAFKYLETSNSNKPYILRHPLTTFDYPDVSYGFLKVNRFHTSLGQDNEIQRLAQAYFKNVAKASKSVLVGVSRGASTLVTFMGIYNPENVAALVLESPFDCIDTIVSQIIESSKLSWIPGIKKGGHNLMSFIFCKYKPNGIRPIDCINDIRKDLPILIICSAQDKLVPVWSSINLYQMFRDTGHTNTYLLVLPEGQHAKLINHKKYGQLYQQVTHTFYQKFQLPHDPQCAVSGMEHFNVCQPDFHALQTFYPNKTKSTKISRNR